MYHTIAHNFHSGQIQYRHVIVMGISGILHTPLALSNLLTLAMVRNHNCRGDRRGTQIWTETGALPIYGKNSEKNSMHSELRTQKLVYLIYNT